MKTECEADEVAALPNVRESNPVPKCGTYHTPSVRVVAVTSSAEVVTQQSVKERRAFKISSAAPQKVSAVHLVSPPRVAEVLHIEPNLLETVSV